MQEEACMESQTVNVKKKLLYRLFFFFNRRFDGLQ